MGINTAEWPQRRCRGPHRVTPLLQPPPQTEPQGIQSRDEQGPKAAQAWVPGGPRAEGVYETQSKAVRGDGARPARAWGGAPPTKSTHACAHTQLHSHCYTHTATHTQLHSCTLTAIHTLLTHSHKYMKHTNNTTEGH